MSTILSKEEKLRILKTLEEDIEFRYAMAGALGLLEILKRLDSIESRIEEHSRILQEHSKVLQEHSKRLEAIESRIEETNKRIEEHSRILQEHSKVLQEHSKRLEAIEMKLEETNKRIEEHSRILQEHSKVLQEHSKRLEEVMKILETLITVVAEHSEKINSLRKEVSAQSLVLGALTESFYAKSVYEDIEKEVMQKGEKILSRIRNARINEIDVDLFIETEKVVYIVEVKVKADYEDVGRLIAKVDVAKKHYIEKNVVGVLAGAMIGKEIEAYAKGKGIIVYKY